MSAVQISVERQQTRSFTDEPGRNTNGKLVREYIAYVSSTFADEGHTAVGYFESFTSRSVLYPKHCNLSELFSYFHYLYLLPVLYSKQPGYVLDCIAISYKSRQASTRVPVRQGGCHLTPCLWTLNLLAIPLELYEVKLRIH